MFPLFSSSLPSGLAALAFANTGSRTGYEAALSSIRADAAGIPAASLTDKIVEWYKTPGEAWDALALFAPKNGNPGETTFGEGAYTLAGRATIGKTPGRADFALSHVEGRAVALSLDVGINDIDAQEAALAGLSLQAARGPAIVDALKVGASRLVWHGSAALGVNGITGSTYTVMGRNGESLTLEGRRHPSLAAKVSDVGALSAATFADAFESLVDAIDFAAVAYGEGYRPDAIVMGPDLWSRLGKIRDTSGSGMTLRAALMGHYPEISADRWKVSHNLKQTGPGGYSGLLAYYSGPMGLAYRLSMAPILTAPYRQGLEERIAGAMKCGGVMIGERPGHCMAWFDAS